MHDLPAWVKKSLRQGSKGVPGNEMVVSGKIFFEVQRQ
jgi:hypothetical protein